jgi:hypothetical protein
MENSGGEAGKLRTDSAMTRERMGNVLDVLDIIAESHGEEAEHITITTTVESLMPGINSDEVQIARGEPQSTLGRAVGIASNEDVLALIPSIILRARTRRRLPGTSHAAAGAENKSIPPW